eukprot:UN17229
MSNFVNKKSETHRHQQPRYSTDRKILQTHLMNNKSDHSSPNQSETQQPRRSIDQTKLTHQHDGHYSSPNQSESSRK